MTRRNQAGLLFGALLAGTAGAHDLPRGAAAPRPSGGCEAYGADYQRIAGTELCVHIGGSVRVEAAISTGGGGVLSSAPRR